MEHRKAIRALRLIVAACVLSLAAIAHGQPSANQALADMGLSPVNSEKVLKGEFVTADVPAVSERDLSFAIAFLVKTSPESLAKQMLAGDLVTADAQVQAYGEIKGAGSLADFAGLKL